MTPTNEEQNLRRLAVALVENPRGTLKDLAESSGISKATLHRLYGTRDNLEKILGDLALRSMGEIIVAAQAEGEPVLVLDRVLGLHLENKEILRVVSLSPAFQSIESWSPYINAIDGLFLRGQEAGTFRVDLSAQALTELFVATLCGMIDAERRGRVASSVVMETTKNFFMTGAQRVPRKEKE